MALEYIKIHKFIPYFILFIILVKFSFSIAYVGHIVLAHTDTFLDDLIGDESLVYWKERTEFIFVICMSSLLIYHFLPGSDNIVVGKETKTLFLFLGVLLLFSAKWTLFLDEESRFVKFINKFK
jgi:hypothetical protein